MDTSAGRDFVIALLGNIGVGKNSLLDCYKEGILYSGGGNDFKIRTIDFFTTRGPVRFNVRVSTGSQTPVTLSDDIYRGIHGAIIIFNMTKRETYENIPNWHRKLVDTTGNIPMMLVGNKIDAKGEMRVGFVNFHHGKNNMQFCGISAKYKYNIDMPFLFLSRKLVGDPQLTFFTAPEVLATSSYDRTENDYIIRRVNCFHQELWDSQQLIPPKNDDLDSWPFKILNCLVDGSVPAIRCFKDVSACVSAVVTILTMNNKDWAFALIGFCVMCALFYAYGCKTYKQG